MVSFILQTPTRPTSVAGGTQKEVVSIVQRAGWTTSLEVSSMTHNTPELALTHLETLVAEEVEGAQAAITAGKAWTTLKVMMDMEPSWSGTEIVSAITT